MSDKEIIQLKHSVCKLICSILKIICFGVLCVYPIPVQLVLIGIFIYISVCFTLAFAKMAEDDDKSKK